MCFIKGLGDSYSNDLTLPFSLPTNVLNPGPIDTLDGGEVSPLVRVGLKTIVQENSVPVLARLVLEWKGDEVPETTARHRVLVREKAIVGFHAELVAPCHSLRDEIAAHSPGDARGNRRAEEEPHVGAIPRSRALDGAWNAQAPTGLEERPDIPLPGCLIEVDRQEPARLIFEERIDADHMPPLKVVEDNLIVDGNECLIRALAALDFRQLADTPYELVRACGRVPTLAGLLADEPGGENVLAAPEELSEQPDLF